jgi:hypothetical protein
MYKIIGADQKEYGPISVDQMRQWIAEGRVNAQTMVQGEGQTDWRPLSTFPEFATVAQPLPSGAPITPASSNAESLVNGPGIALMVVGILYALIAVLGIVGNIVGWGFTAFGPAGRGAGNIPPEFERMARHMGGAVGVVMAVAQLALAGFYILASTKLRKLESYGLVMTATILSMLPCVTPSCCCVVGLPIGIWILVVLSKPEVKSAFH